ncbi:MAG: RsmE family RNA methyltransferase [Chlamydiales bacterium]
MPAERFFFDGDLHGTIEVEGAEHHHLAHVMRMRVSDEVEIVNGRGAIASARVAEIGKHSARLDILSVTQDRIPSPLLTLAVPLMRLAKLELVIEKCTELGASAFWLYPAQHSEKDDLSPHQQERLKFIAISAMKQCGRLDLPAIKLVGSLDDLFQGSELYRFGHPQSECNAAYSEEESIFISGPEKGFSEKELTILKERAQGVRLHRNILRAETAPIVAAVLLG